jgi:hypothetical protein
MSNSLLRTIVSTYKYCTCDLLNVDSLAHFYKICVEFSSQTYLFYFLQLMGVEAFIAHHHAGDVGPPPVWGGIADDGPDAPCAIAGLFGCAPINSTYDYWKNGVPWEGPPVVFH